jgi:hypothetical protein
LRRTAAKRSRALLCLFGRPMLANPAYFEVFKVLFAA